MKQQICCLIVERENVNEETKQRYHVESSIVTKYILFRNEQNTKICHIKKKIIV